MRRMRTEGFEALGGRRRSGRILRAGRYFLVVKVDGDLGGGGRSGESNERGIVLLPDGDIGTLLVGIEKRNGISLALAICLCLLLLPPPDFVLGLLCFGVNGIQERLAPQLCTTMWVHGLVRLIGGPHSTRGGMSPGCLLHGWHARRVLFFPFGQPRQLHQIAHMTKVAYRQKSSLWFL